MSCGLATTRRISLRRIGLSSASHSRSQGSAVAIVTSRVVTSTGRILKRVA